jgi:hypothetical protein
MLAISSSQRAGTSEQLYTRITEPFRLSSFPRKQRALVFIGVAGFCWALWLSRNDMVFQKSKRKSFLQVMFRGTY